jgi:predicted SAM-dependent methyltransferase
MFHWLLRTLPRPLLIRFSLWFSKLAPLLYYGKRYEDPINGQTYRTFLPYGYDGRAKRKNALCPGTLSLERHRLLWLFLKRHSNFFTSNLNVLHIAPEQCFYKRFKAMPNLTYTTADYNSPIADLHFDLHKTPLPDNSYDVILCNHVLEHVEDDMQCMRELFRLMKPGGWGVFQVPLDTTRETTYEDSSITSPEARTIHFWQKDHVRLYGRDYPQRLSAAGFKVSAFNLCETLGPEAVERYRLPQGEWIYMCQKV